MLVTKQLVPIDFHGVRTNMIVWLPTFFKISLTRGRSHRTCLKSRDAALGNVLLFRALNASSVMLLSNNTVAMPTCYSKQKLATHAPPPHSSDWSTVLELTLMSVKMLIILTLHGILKTQRSCARSECNTSV